MPAARSCFRWRRRISTMGVARSWSRKKSNTKACGCVISKYIGRAATWTCVEEAWTTNLRRASHPPYPAALRPDPLAFPTATSRPWITATKEEYNRMLKRTRCWETGTISSRRSSANFSLKRARNFWAGRNYRMGILRSSNSIRMAGMCRSHSKSRPSPSATSRLHATFPCSALRIHKRFRNWRSNYIVR